MIGAGLKISSIFCKRPKPSGLDSNPVQIICNAYVELDKYLQVWLNQNQSNRTLYRDTSTYEESERSLPTSTRFFSKNGPTPASFCLFSVFSNEHYKFLQQLYLKKCPSSIRCWNSNPRPLERESLLITTRPGLPPLQVLRCFVPYLKRLHFLPVRRTVKNNGNSSRPGWTLITLICLA